MLRHRKALLLGYLALTHVLIYQLVYSGGAGGGAPLAPLSPPTPTAGTDPLGTDFWSEQDRQEAERRADERGDPGERLVGAEAEARRFSRHRRQAEEQQASERRCPDLHGAFRCAVVAHAPSQL